MDLLIQGIGVGILLSILMGPILFALIQTGIEEGFRAGAMVGLGIWVSDFLFILSVYFGIAYVEQVTQWEWFEPILGIGGGIVLAAFGLGTWFSKPPQVPEKLLDDTIGEVVPRSMSSYLSLWLKGFLINTLNPFTFFFWLGLMGTFVINQSPSHSEAFLYFVGVLGTIIITDVLKVYFAKTVRHLLRPNHLIWIRRVSGAALVIFGVVLVIRVLF